MSRATNEELEDMLIVTMFSENVSLARQARELFDKRHAKDDLPVREPRHCEHCFEGCERCGK